MWVAVDTDLCVGPEVDEVYVHVTGADPVSRPLVGPEGITLPALLEVDRVTEATLVDAEAELRLEGAVVATSTARALFVPGRAVLLRISLWRRCDGVMCGSDEACSEDGSCASDLASDLPHSPVIHRRSRRTPPRAHAMTASTAPTTSAPPARAPTPR